MPAPDLSTLFAFEPQIEAAVVAALGAVGVNGYRQRSASSLHTPYVLVQLRSGPATGHRKTFMGAQFSPVDTYPNAWQAHLILTVVTNRTTTVGNADRHDELVGKCRVAMLQATGALNTGLSWLSIQSISDAGMIPSERPDDKLDMSPLAFALRFAIRGDAWPTAVAG